MQKKRCYSTLSFDLKDNKLTIPQELFDKCEKMNVEISKFPDIIAAFRSQEVAQKYTGLVGIRKLLSLQKKP